MEKERAAGSIPCKLLGEGDANDIRERSGIAKHFAYRYRAGIRVEVSRSLENEKSSQM